jgi:hypothetical protein
MARFRTVVDAILSFLRAVIKYFPLIYRRAWNLFKIGIVSSETGAGFVYLSFVID